MYTARDQLRLSRRTLQNYSIINSKPQRYATQYVGDAEISTSMFNSDYELIRSKEKYRWKCDEIDREKKQLSSEFMDLELRTEVIIWANQQKLRQAENEIRQLVAQLKQRLKCIKQQEQQLKENQQKLEVTYKEKELTFMHQQRQIKEKQEELNLKEQQLIVLEKSIQEKQSLVEDQLLYYNSINEKLKFSLENTNQKEKFYDLQINKLNQNVETLLHHESLILNLEFQLTQQIQSLKEFENQIRLQIQNCRHQDDQMDVQEQNLLKGQELINRKILWDQKNLTKLHCSSVANFLSQKNQTFF